MPIAYSIFTENVLQILLLWHEFLERRYQFYTVAYDMLGNIVETIILYRRYKIISEG